MCRSSWGAGCPPSRLWACRTSRWRRAGAGAGALAAIGLALPAKRIIVNLSPADLAKEGSHYDLPIALGLLTALGAISTDAVANMSAWASSVSMARLAAVPGVLPSAASPPKGAA